AFCAALPEDARPAADAYEAWAFGDSEAMADELSALVREGIKTATASLLWEYENEGSSLPQVGAYSIILDGGGQPQCIIRTTEVIIRPFNEFDAAFAYDEGEGDRTLAFWRRAHWDFFTRTCAVIGRTPDETMPIVGERFERVYLSIASADD
ncbi:MAG: ASCH domain-containing protein, partial [Chloroflexota bacterium]|nr:ASCH domain-containing protein [Chloroflexota bacterium]